MNFLVCNATNQGRHPKTTSLKDAVLRKLLGHGSAACVALTKKIHLVGSTLSSALDAYHFNDSATNTWGSVATTTPRLYYSDYH